MQRSNQNDVTIVIPALNPDEKMLQFLSDLRKRGFEKIIIVNDGSRKDTLWIFEEANTQFGCTILNHYVNLGQGRAYKTAFNYYLGSQIGGGESESQSIGIIQCDCDGQHSADDVVKCAELMHSNPEKFIIGVRDFSDKSIPFRSRFGNHCTSVIFKIFCGLDLKDTQTGLKGIPNSMLTFLIETSGERFEYASSVLLEAKSKGVEFVQFPIETIYINGNETSHFNPIIDSIRIYSLILRYMLSSLTGFVMDIVIYSILIGLLENVFPDYYIVISTYISRIFLSICIFLINKKIVFHNSSSLIPTAIKFFVLCLSQATVSGLTVRFLVGIFGGGKIIIKIFVDTLLFFVSFQIQDRWVFKNTYKSKKMVED